MLQVSVVIITKNESVNIADCIASARKISTDIIVIDCGSTDTTLAIAKKENVRVQSVTWKGYGHSRNTGAWLAKNDWIFSLDADERVSAELANSINTINLPDNRFVYGCKRINYFCGKKIRYGAFAHDKIFRLYNRQYNQWNDAPVHEKLTGKNLQMITNGAHVIHYTAREESVYRKKIMGYANLCALKYLQQKKRFIQVSSWVSPAFDFVKAYIFQLGFLDEQRGFSIAKINAQYTRKKYQLLLNLMNKERKHSPHTNSFRHLLRSIVSFLFQ